MQLAKLISLSLFFIFSTTISFNNSLLAETKRIVSLKPNITSTLIELGAKDQIVGITRYCNWPNENAPKRVADYLGPKTEAVVALEPDVVFSSKENSLKAPTKKLQDMGLNVILLSFKNLNEISNSIIELGRITNHNKKAQEIAKRIKAIIEKNPKQNTTAIMVVGTKPLIAVGQNTYLSELMQSSGLKNIAPNRQTYPRMSIEELYISKPNIIIDVTSNGIPKKSVWQNLPCLPSLLSTAKKWNWSVDALVAFCDDLHKNNIDVGEVGLLLEHSQKDEVELANSMNRNEFLSLLKKLRDKCKTNHIGRLSLKIVRAIFRKHSKDRPLIVVDMATSDHNGAFYGLYEELDEFVEQGYDFNLQEVGNEDEIYEHMEEASKTKLANVWMVAGHGSADSVRLSDNDDSDEKNFLDRNDGEVEKRIGPCLAENAHVVLNACETAGRLWNEFTRFFIELFTPQKKNLAIAMTHNLPINVTVWGNTLSGNTQDILFFETGMLEYVKYKAKGQEDTGVKLKKEE